MIITIEHVGTQSDVVVADAEEAEFAQSAKIIIVAKHGWSDTRKKDTDFPQWVENADWRVCGYGGQFAESGSDLLILIGERLHCFLDWTDVANKTLAPLLPAELIDFKSMSKDERPEQHMALAKYALPRMKELGILFLTRDEQYGSYRLMTKEDYE